MRRLVHLVFLPIVLCFLASCGSDESDEVIIKDQVRSRACITDSQCAIVSTRCCGCGGFQALHVDEVADFVHDCPEDISCPGEICMQPVAVCRNRECAVGP